MRSALLLILPALAACSTAPPVTVEVPVPVPCISRLPVAPIACIPADQTRPEWLRCALGDLAGLKGYVPQLEAAIKACQAP